MPDINTEVLTCAECGKNFPRTNPMGRKPTYCTECALESRRSSAREWARRDTKAHPFDVKTTFDCIGCSGTFERPILKGTIPLRCKACLRLQQAQQLRDWRADKRAGFLPRARPLTTPCADCGVQMALASTGPARLRCDGCGKKRDAERKSEYARNHRASVSRPRRVTRCRGCGVKIETSNRGKRQRCTPCGLEHKKVVLRRWFDNNPGARQELDSRRCHRRRAILRGLGVERFNRVEIYERDRWKCGICRRRINRKLRYPHPMSASLDHVIPVSQNGPHTRANVRASHLQCNTARRNRGGNEQLALVG